MCWLLKLLPHQRHRVTSALTTCSVAGLPSRMMSASPRRVISAAARSTRGSMPSGRTMRCRCSVHLHNGHCIVRQRFRI